MRELKKVVGTEFNGLAQDMVEEWENAEKNIKDEKEVNINDLKAAIFSKMFSKLSERMQRVHEAFDGAEQRYNQKPKSFLRG